jgi:hypothetical protein
MLKPPSLRYGHHVNTGFFAAVLLLHALGWLEQWDVDPDWMLQLTAAVGLGLSSLLTLLDDRWCSWLHRELSVMAAGLEK